MPKFKRSRKPESAPALDAGVALVAPVSDAVTEAENPGASPPSDGPGHRLVGAVDDEFWGLKTVVTRTGLSRSSIYSYVEQGLFPRQRRLGPRRVGWLASEVRIWMASRPL